MFPIHRIHERSVPAAARVGAAIAALAVTVPVSAGLTFATAPAPGGFVQACAGPSTPGSSPWPGSDFTTLFTAAGSDVQEESFAGDAGAAASASYSGGSTVNGCTGAVSLGVIDFAASNDAPNSSFFAAANANGGWSETFVVSHPDLAGQAGFMQFTLDVSGSFFASGFAGSAGFTVTGYKDAGQLLANPLFDPGDSDLLSSDRQYGNWGVATFGNPPTASKTVNDTVTFAVPIVFGTEFKLGIYAAARAGMRSSSGVAGNSTAEVTAVLTWGGVSAVYHNGVAIEGYAIASGSGADWSGPIGPADPADLNGDGVVDGGDLGLLLAGWGTPAGDLNGDGTTDGADLGILLAAWG